MANLNDTHDPTGGEVMRGREPLPIGEYTAAIVKSDRSEPNAKGNRRLDIEFNVTDGEFSGRRFWTSLNLWNDNHQAVEIAFREFNAIKHACGRLNVSDSSELHGIPMRIYVGAKKGEPERREPKSYKPLNGAPAGQRQQSQPAGNAGGGGGSSSAPWKRSA